MPSRLIKTSNRGINLDRLNPQQMMFVECLLSDLTFNPAAAARSAGYKCSAQSATKLLKNPLISAAIGKAIKLRLERVQLNGDDVLEHLRIALFLNPFELFECGADGKWTIRNPKDMPPEVARCVTKMKVKEVVDDDGTVTRTFELELMDKNMLLGYALKHLGLAGESKSSLDVNVNTTDSLLLSLLKEVDGKSNVVDAVDVKMIEEQK